MERSFERQRVPLAREHAEQMRHPELGIEGAREFLRLAHDPAGDAVGTGRQARRAASRSRHTATFAGWPPGRRFRLPLLTFPQRNRRDSAALGAMPHCATNAGSRGRVYSSQRRAGASGRLVRIRSDPYKASGALKGSRAEEADLGRS